MNITTKTTTNGKFITTVTKGGRVVLVTPAYVTKAMALADARCWIAFNGGNMHISANEIYTGYQAEQRGPKLVNVPVPASVERVTNAIAQAEKFKLSVDVRTSPAGHQYIEIHNGKGSSYSKWWIGQAAQNYVMANFAA